MDQYKYADGQKTSVKVHHQPGGASQWSFGWAGDDNNGPVNQNRNLGKPPINNNNYLQHQQINRQLRQENYQQAPQLQQGQPQRPPIAFTTNDREPYQQPQRVNYNQLAQQQNQNFGVRVDSGERTSVKVHNPPGGKSSLNIFGGYDAVEQNVSPSRLRPKPREVQYKIGAQYQVTSDLKQQNGFGSQYNQASAVQQWQQQQNQRSAAKLPKYEEQSQLAVQWPSRQPETDLFQGNGMRQPSPQRMAAQNVIQQGYVPSQFNNNQNMGVMRKSQQVQPKQSYSYEHQPSYGYQPPKYQQQQSDLNFGGIKQTQPPGGRSQIVLN